MKENTGISILGCGWLGLSLAKYFVNQNYIVKGSTTSAHKTDLIKNIGVEPFIVDIENQSEDFGVFLNSELLIIAITSKNVEAYISLINKVGTSTIKKVLFISSTSVYPFNNSIVSEESETIKTPLVVIENLFKKTSTFNSTIIRFGGLFDEQRHPGKFIKRASQLKNPRGRVNLIHKSDCIKCIAEIINNQAWDKTFNACANSHPTREEFYSKQLQNIGLKSPVFNQVGPTKFKIVNSDEIRKALNFKFKYDDLMKF